MRAWSNHMVHHGLYYRQNYSYFGIIEALSGAPFDVSFISFDDIKNDKNLLDNFDVIINVGDADTAQSGGEYWADEEIVTAVKQFVYNGGGFIGVGEPAAHQWQGKFFQLDDILGVEEENGFTLNTRRYNTEEHRDHFILADADGEVDFGEGKRTLLHSTELRCLSKTQASFRLLSDTPKRCKWQLKSSARAEVFISADFRIHSKTAACSTAQFFGAHRQRTSLTVGIRQTTMSRYTHMLKTANIA